MLMGKYKKSFLPKLVVLFVGFNFDTEDGDKVLPGFLNSIIGIQRGETKSFPFTFPESWKQENLRGVQAQFTVGCFLSSGSYFYFSLLQLNVHYFSFSNSVGPSSGISLLLHKILIFCWNFLFS